MESKEISIIVPVFNVENYLEECIESIVTQNYKDIELILVDDGSTDKSGIICDAYKIKYPDIVILHKSNGGLADARNSGIKIATGKFLLFIDSDDYISENCLEHILKAANEQEEPDVLFLNAEKFFPSGERYPLEEKMDISRIYDCARSEVLAYLATRKKYPGSACTKLISRNLVISNELFFEVGKTSEDLDWTRKVLMNAKSFGYCNCDYYNYRQCRKGSITNTLSQKNMDDLCIIVDRWIEIAETSPVWQRQILLSFSSYEYKIILAAYSSPNCTEKRKNITWIKEHEFLLSYRNDFDIRLIRIVLKLIGIRLTSLLLNKYIKYRKK